jgi:uncharacterized membrane protein YcaP (DUF421 family)
VLILSEAIQQALIDDDNSMTNAFIIVLTMVGLDLAISEARQRWPLVARATESVPLVLMRDGVVDQRRLAKEHLDVGDILTAARREGLETIEQIKHAILEKDGSISVVPRT